MRLLRYLVLPGLLVLAPITTTPDPRSATADTEWLPVPVPGAAVAWAEGGDTCILRCYELCVGCDNCGSGVDEHVAFKVGDSHEYGGGWHDSCVEGDCPEKHPFCEPNLAASTDLKRAVRERAQYGAYAALAKAHPGIISIVDKTLRMYGCDGELIASLPLPQSVGD